MLCHHEVTSQGGVLYDSTACHHLATDSEHFRVLLQVVVMSFTYGDTKKALNYKTLKKVFEFFLESLFFS